MRKIIYDGVEASDKEISGSFSDYLRLNNLKTSLRFPCLGINPIIDSLNLLLSISCCIYIQYENMNTEVAGFESGSIKEYTKCQPRRQWLPQYSSVCNLTMDNGGMSWYCGKPNNTKLLCEDWTYVTTTSPVGKKLMNDVEYTLLT